jgi:hypothetical protein
MSSQLCHSTFSIPPVIVARRQREALWRRVGRAVWNELEAMGQARAEKEMQRLASYCAESNPELSRQFRCAAMQLGANGA